MEYIYETKGTCAKRIKFNIDGNVITNVKFLDGGCPGNLQAVPRLVEGKTVEEITSILGGIQCGSRGTSCADQLVQGINKAYQNIQEN